MSLVGQKITEAALDGAFEPSLYIRTTPFTTTSDTYVDVTGLVFLRKRIPNIKSRYLDLLITILCQKRVDCS